MKNWLKLSSFAIKFRDAFNRFPVVICWAIVGTLISLFTIENKEVNKPFWIRIVLTFILGVSWLISTNLLKRKSKKKTFLFYLIPTAVLSYFYFFVAEYQNGIDSESVLLFFLYLQKVQILAYCMVLLVIIIGYWLLIIGY